MRMPVRACGGWRVSSGSTCPQISASGPKGRITKDDLLSFLKGPAQPAARGAGRRAGVGDPGGPGAGLLQVRPGAAPGPAADQEGVGPVPAPVVAQCPARHAQRRGRHHRARRLPQAARHRGEGREEPVPGDAAGVPGQGRGRRAEEAPGVQLEPEPGEGRHHREGVLQHRHRRRHTRRPGRPGGQATPTARASST